MQKQFFVVTNNRFHHFPQLQCKDFSSLLLLIDFILHSCLSDFTCFLISPTLGNLFQLLVSLRPTVRNHSLVLCGGTTVHTTNCVHVSLQKHSPHACRQAQFVMQKELQDGGCRTSHSMSKRQNLNRFTETFHQSLPLSVNVEYPLLATARCRRPGHT